MQNEVPSLSLRRLPIAAFVAVVALCSGCSTFDMNAWDRDLLAKRSMQFNTHPLITASDEHIYFSKEGSSGGRTFDGGGCGCN